MTIDFAVVPVAGRGTRLLPLTKSQPKEMLPVGRKPVVQYVVEELARCGIGRLLFVTGPGKTAIENHFDIDAELVDSLRKSGREELLNELAFEREDLGDFLYAAAAAAWAGACGSLCQAGCREATVCGRPGGFDYRAARRIPDRADDDRGIRRPRAPKGSSPSRRSRPTR